MSEFETDYSAGGSAADAVFSQPIDDGGGYDEGADEYDEYDDDDDYNLDELIDTGAITDPSEIVQLMAADAVRQGISPLAALAGAEQATTRYLEEREQAEAEAEYWEGQQALNYGSERAAEITAAAAKEHGLAESSHPQIRAHAEELYRAAIDECHRMGRPDLLEQVSAPEVAEAAIKIAAEQARVARFAATSYSDNDRALVMRDPERAQWFGRQRAEWQASKEGQRALQTSHARSRR